MRYERQRQPRRRSALGLSRSALYRRLERARHRRHVKPRAARAPDRPSRAHRRASGASSRRSCSLWRATTRAKTRWTPDRRDRVDLARLRAGAARSRRSAAPDDVEPAHGAARGRLLDPRPRRAAATTPLGDVLDEINALGETLREQRLGALEATALLRPGHGGDRRRDLRVRRGVALCGSSTAPASAFSAIPADACAAQRAAELGLDGSSTTDAPADHRAQRFRGGSGRWEVRRSAFRRTGSPHRLIVLTDVEPRAARGRAAGLAAPVRVLGHELNNSLAPDPVDRRQPRSGSRASPSRPADWRRGPARMASRSSRRARRR